MTISIIGHKYHYGPMVCSQIEASKIAWSHDLKSRKIAVYVHLRNLAWNQTSPAWKRRNIYKPPVFGFHFLFFGGETTQLSFQTWILKVVSAVLFCAWPFRATWAMEGILWSCRGRTIVPELKELAPLVYSVNDWMKQKLASHITQHRRVQTGMTLFELLLCKRSRCNL